MRLSYPDRILRRWDWWRKPVSYTHLGNYWTNPVNYDMTLNSERVGVQNCVKTIEQYLIIKGLITSDMADHSTAVLKGFPTSEGKPAPGKGKAFSGMLKIF